MYKDIFKKLPSTVSNIGINSNSKQEAKEILDLFYVVLNGKWSGSSPKYSHLTSKSFYLSPSGKITHGTSYSATVKHENNEKYLTFRSLENFKVFLEKGDMNLSIPTVTYSKIFEVYNKEYNKEFLRIGIDYDTEDEGKDTIDFLLSLGSKEFSSKRYVGLKKPGIFITNRGVLVTASSGKPSRREHERYFSFTSLEDFKQDLKRLGLLDSTNNHSIIQNPINNDIRRKTKVICRKERISGTAVRGRRSKDAVRFGHLSYRATTL